MANGVWHGLLVGPVFGNLEAPTACRLRWRECCRWNPIGCGSKSRIWAVDSGQEGRFTRSTGWCWSRPGVWVAPWRLADDYHVYGLDWTPDEIKYYVDGVVVRTVENTHWHQPLFLIVDSETMPEWFGMPDDEDLPSTYSIEYVRAWKQKQ